MLNSKANGVKMQNAKQYITEDEDGYRLCINVNEKCGNYTVESIDFYVAKDADYGTSDLAVCYDISTLQNDETAQTMGTLLLRNIDSDDAFTARLNEILAECGFANTAHTSEWGMQDEGRASYDAYDLADEIRAIMQTTTA
jgi:hypothetical protein